jgi:hypothetical protein
MRRRRRQPASAATKPTMLTFLPVPTTDQHGGVGQRRAVLRLPALAGRVQLVLPCVFFSSQRFPLAGADTFNAFSTLAQRRSHLPAFRSGSVSLRLETPSAFRCIAGQRQRPAQWLAARVADSVATNTLGRRLGLQCDPDMVPYCQDYRNKGRIDWRVCWFTSLLPPVMPPPMGRRWHSGDASKTITIASAADGPFVLDRTPRQMRRGHTDLEVGGKSWHECTYACQHTSKHWCAPSPCAF